MSEPRSIEIEETGEATGRILLGGSHEPITVIGTKTIRDELEEGALQQAINSKEAPGVDKVVVNPDAHIGYGAPVGCVMASRTHIYPGPVGVDIKCSMSLLQLDLDQKALEESGIRERLIHAICRRIPTGMGKGQRDVPKGRKISKKLGFQVATEGASTGPHGVLSQLGIPDRWAERCEDSHHVGHNGSKQDLKDRLYYLQQTNRRIGDKFEQKINQLGSYGGGNHFGECEAVEVQGGQEEVAEKFGLKDGKVAFLSHCGSRGLGHNLADGQFKTLQAFFDSWSMPYPGQDKELVYAPLGTPQANDYLDDMALGANFATVNHLLINQLVLEAFQEIIPGIAGELVYFISHNIARKEIVNGKPHWVHRKGATRAFPAKHHGLKGSPFYFTGHPILLPGNPTAGSAVMVAEDGAEKSCYSVNHGAGRRLGRRRAKRELNQRDVNNLFKDRDIATNCTNYPLDEAPRAYKDFKEVLKSVEQAGLASKVAMLRARFVIKDADKADD